MRVVFKHIPSGPRCRLCAAPFGGVGGPMMRALGRRRSIHTPTMCDACFRFIGAHHGGAEIDCTMLFADIRGSTTLAESMSASEFHALLDRFYTVATEVVFDHDGTVDKFVGDELVAIFIPLLSGDQHAKQAVAAAQALLRETGHGEPGGPWVPLGAGVHTAITWFGAVGPGIARRAHRGRRPGQHDRAPGVACGRGRDPRDRPCCDGGGPRSGSPAALARVEGQAGHHRGRDAPRRRSRLTAAGPLRLQLGQQLADQ